MTESDAMDFKACAALILFAGAESLAEPLVTDRPSVSESSKVVDRAVYQLEQGVQYTVGEGRDGWELPSLHRLGLGSRAELRVLSPLLSLQEGALQRPEFSVGGKWNVIHGDKPSVGILFHAVFQEDGRSAPEVKLLWDYALTRRWSFSVNLGGTQEEGAALASGAVSIQRVLFAEKLRMFVEVSAKSPLKGTDWEGGVDAGVLWLLTRDVQLDVVGYKAVNPGGTWGYWGVGFSGRVGG